MLEVSPLQAVRTGRFARLALERLLWIRLRDVVHVFTGVRGHELGVFRRVVCAARTGVPVGHVVW